MMKRTFRRIGLILTILVFVLVLAGFFTVRWYLAPYVKQALETHLADASDGLYQLSLEKLQINLLTGTMRAQNLAIDTDTARWKTLCLEQPAKMPRKIVLRVKSVDIIRVRWWHYWKTRRLEVAHVNLATPELELASVQDSSVQQAANPDTAALSLLDRLPRLLAPHAKSLTIHSVSVRRARVLLCAKTPKKETIQSADSIFGKISNIHIEAADTAASGRALYADDIALDLRHYRLWTRGRRYLFSIGSARLAGRDSLLEIKDCVLRSVGSDSITFAEPALRKPRATLSIPETAIYGLDLFRALHRNEWQARRVQATGAYISLANNMSLPLPLNRKMPNELWQRLKFPLTIDTVSIKNADIFYQEKTDDEQGKLTFRQVQGLILNLSNDPARMTDTTPVRVYASARFMGTGDLSVALSIPLLAPNFCCYYQAALLDMPFSDLNALIEPKNGVRIEQGFADEVAVRATATNGITKGSVKIYYHGLKVSVLKEDSEEKKPLVTALANLAIRNNSDDKKEDRPFRTADIAYSRDPADGFLRLLWRAAQSGLVKTLTNVKVTPKKTDRRGKKN